MEKLRISPEFSQEHSSHCLISPVSVASNIKKTPKTLPHLHLPLLTSLFVLWFNLLRAEQDTHFPNMLCCSTSRPQLKSKGNKWSRNLLEPIKSLVKVSNRLSELGIPCHLKYSVFPILDQVWLNSSKHILIFTHTYLGNSWKRGLINLTLH